MRNCLTLPVSSGRALAKTSGETVTLTEDGKLVERVADVEARRVDETDHVAGICLVDRGALGAEHRRGVLGRERLPGAVAREHHAALEPSRTDADERDPIAM